MTTTCVNQLPVVLSVGDTTYLDYGQIKVKREGYGPQGHGGNGLLLHSALAVDPEQGQPLGLLWQKVWHRPPLPQPPTGETRAQRQHRCPDPQSQSRQVF